MESIVDEIEVKICFGCKVELDIPKRKYFGKVFCDYCYQRKFIRKTCNLCQNNKRIFEQDDTCQTCLVQTLPCIRCNRIGQKIGKLVEQGIICNSCSVFFRKLRKCDECGKEKRYIHNYSLFDSQKIYCSQCIKKLFHQKCSSCKNKNFIYACNLKQDKFCKKCFLNKKYCRICHIDIPAGSWTTECRSCGAKRLFIERKEEYVKEFDPLVRSLYEAVLNILCEQKGYIIAARMVLQLSPVFKQMNRYYFEFKILPSSSLVKNELKKFKVNYTNLILKVMHDVGSRNHEEFLIKEKIANQILKISITNQFYDCFTSYVEKINKKTSQLHSKRLAITSAVMFVRFVNILEKKEINQIIVDQFCWLHWGQRASLTGFINHLNIYYDLKLIIKDKGKFVFEKRRESKVRLEQQIISILLIAESTVKNHLLQKVFTYMHNIEFPDDLKNVDVVRLVSVKDSVRLKGITFYLGLGSLNFTKLNATND